MWKKLKKKLNSRAGETIGETLVALLIAALALAMLAGAVTASSGIVRKSEAKMDDYYAGNERLAAMSSGGTTGQVVEIKDTTNVISDQSYDIAYYVNDAFGGKPVIAYKRTN